MVRLLLLTIQEAAEEEIQEAEEGDTTQAQVDLIRTLSLQGTYPMETW